MSNEKLATRMVSENGAKILELYNTIKGDEGKMSDTIELTEGAQSFTVTVERSG